MHFHAQNLNEKADGTSGSILRHGRCWLHLGNLDRGRRPTLGLCWSVPTSFAHISLQFGEAYEGTIQLSFACGLFAVWVTIDGFVGDWLPRNRECEISFHHGTLWIKPWSRRWESRGSDPWWVRGLSFNFADILLGRPQYSDRTISETDSLVPMPEGSYPAKVRMFESTWTRPRWFAERILRAEVDVAGGVPIMGKGENSWDCGEDAVYSSTCPAKSVEDAIGKMVSTVLTRRKRYGRPQGLQPVMSPRVKPAE